MTPFNNVSFVTQTFPPRTGGIESVMAALAKRFSDSGSKVKVFPDRNPTLSPTYEYHLIRAPKLIRWIFKKFLVAIHCNQDDLIICDSWKSARAVPNSFHNLVILAHGQEYLDPTKTKRIQIALNRARLVVCSSNATKRLVEERSPAVEGKTVTVYPTYMLDDNEHIFDRKPDDEITKLITLCRLERRKGLFNAMIALAQLKKKGLKFRWKICGSGPHEDELRQACEELKLNENVDFLGHVTESEKSELLGSSDVFLMPSYQDGGSLEGFGITYVEAAAHGLPSIGGIAGGAPEAVNPPSCGWTCDGSSPDAIRETLSIALSNSDLLYERGSNARQNFTENFLGSHVFLELKTLIQEKIK